MEPTRLTACAIMSPRRAAHLLVRQARTAFVTGKKSSGDRPHSLERFYAA